MKRYCKDIDITDRNYIRSCIYECLSGGKNKKSKMSRRDTLMMFSDYSHLPYDFLKGIADTGQYKLFDGIIDTITEGIRHEIINKEYVWKPIWHSYRRENNKTRKLGIQDIKQQLYDYIAVNGLKELLDKKIGQYQCAAITGRGQVYGKNAIKRWIADKSIRHVWQGDGRHYYENINSRILKRLLRRYVKNESLLHLVFALIDSFEKGLEIGSYLSQYLANFYMSFAYHWAEEHLYKLRKCKDGTVKRVPLIHHQLYYMDDILFFASSLKDLKRAVRMFDKFVSDELDIEIKEDAKFIDLRTGYIDTMGFCISREKVIARSRIFIRYRRDIKRVVRYKLITKRIAHALISRDGWMKNANCKHWKKKHKADEIIKICKGMVSNEKDVVRLETKSGHYSVAA